jgi:hypothetical protein
VAIEDLVLELAHRETGRLKARTDPAGDVVSVGIHDDIRAGQEAQAVLKEVELGRAHFCTPG